MFLEIADNLVKDKWKCSACKYLSLLDNDTLLYYIYSIVLGAGDKTEFPERMSRPIAFTNSE